MYKLGFVVCFWSFVSVSSGVNEDDFLYTAVTPIKVYPNSDLNVITTLHRGTKFPINFHYKLEDVAGATLAEREASFTAIGDKDVIIPVQALIQDAYNLSLLVTSKGEKIHEDRVLLQKEKMDKAILIQTDKPVYKPGEEVKFRIFYVNRFFQPIATSKAVVVSIFDPQRNVIKSYPKTAPIVIPGDRGFTSNSFQLSTEPNLGSWSIEVKDIEGEANNANLNFDVDQYVLPKYKVDLSLSPTYVTYNESKTTLQIAATYTHGKPVDATCTATLKEPHSYYRPEGRVPLVSKTVSIPESSKGVAHIEFDLKSELNLKRDEIQKWGKTFQFAVSCKDSNSGHVKNATSAITMYQLPYKVEMSERPTNIRPGFPLNVTFKVIMQDGSPLGGEDLKVEHGFTFDKESGIVSKKVPNNGIVTFTFVTSKNPKICYEALDVTYKDFKDSFWLPSKNVNPSGSYMQLELVTPSKDIIEGEEITVNIETSKAMKNKVMVLITARGKVVDKRQVNANGRTHDQIRIKMPPISAPKANVLIYTTFDESDDVIAEGLKLDVNPSKGKQVEISVDPNVQEPGENITIVVKSPKSDKAIYGLRAVDQSVLLLKADNDLTLDKLRNVANSFKSHGNYWGGSDIFQQFTDNELTVMTNAKLEKGHNQNYPAFGGRPEALPMYSKISSADTAEFAMAIPTRDRQPPGAGAGGFDSTPPRVRSNFPETWIFEDFEASGQEQLQIHKTVPDTITSWFISGFQISPRNGLIVSFNPAKVTVFRPFFVTLNLPYSLIRGEVLALQVLVHNYQDRDVEAKVSLSNDDEFFKFLEENELPGTKLDKTISLKPESIGSLIFPIVPIKHGIMRLKVTAVTSNSGDSVEQTLLVNPPGIKHIQNHAMLVNLLGQTPFEAHGLTTTFPEHRVKDADSLKVSVIGDVMGGTMQNIHTLIKLPSGCGEQNMVNFVPNIVVLEYLNKTEELDPEIKRKATSFLESGYQRQLTYLRNDGSYSAFGKSDSTGSTWLTAFVTRSFFQAKNWITIDPLRVMSSLRFLVRMQNDNGSFNEDGFVHDKYLQGGTANSRNNVALTAFTILTFIEARDNPFTEYNEGIDYNKIIQDATRFITTPGVLDTTDSYAVNLVSYVLHRIGHDKKNDFFRAVKDLERESKDGTLYWDQSTVLKRPEETSKPGILQIYRPLLSRPATIEITSYALLTHLLRNDLDSSFKITKFLLQRRNENGGFISTQDTVVGITALGKLAQAIATKDTNLEVQVIPSDHKFKVDTTNKMEKQEYIIPESVKEVSLKGTGKGTALAQLSWTYYIEDVEKEPSFNLTTTVSESDKGRTLTLHMCYSYLLPGKSNMALLQANTPSGYAFDTDELDSLRRSQNHFKRYDLENKDAHLNIYFDSVSKKESCLDVKAYRVYLVAKHQPSEISVIDYYDNTQKASVLYSVPETVMTLCDICKEDKTCGNIKEC